MTCIGGTASVLARFIDRPRGRIRGPIGRPQIPDAVFEHGQAPVETNYYAQHQPQPAAGVNA